VSGRRYQAADGPDAGSEPSQVGDQVVGGGVQCLVGHRVERVEDEQRCSGVLAQLGAVRLGHPAPWLAGGSGRPAADQPDGRGDEQH